MFIIYLLTLCTCADISYAKDQGLRLELIQVIFRHAARTPSEIEARHINVTDSSLYVPDGYSVLTTEGKRQAYTLGTLLRQKYNSFLGVYKPQDLYATSTSSSRTKMSLAIVLAGLYPPSEKEKWNLQLNWRPIPFYSIPAGKVDAFLAPHDSPKFQELLQKEIAGSEVYKKQMAEYSNFLNYLEEKTGFSFVNDTVYHIGWTYYVIKIHKMLNLPLPKWCTDDVFSRSERVFYFCLQSMSLTPKLKRINGGTLIRRVIEIINSSRNATDPRKIYLYSTHDLTLNAFTQAHNVTTPFMIPPFSSAIILEKYSSTQKEEYVRMLAYDGFNPTFVPVNISNCEYFCPMKNYTAIIQDVIPSDEEINYLQS